MPKLNIDDLKPFIYVIYAKRSRIQSLYYLKGPHYSNYVILNAKVFFCFI